MHHQEMGQLQASLKQLLHRSQASADILPEPLSCTPLQRTAEELQSMVLAHNPAVSVNVAGVQKQDAQLRAADARDASVTWGFWPGFSGLGWQ